MIYAETTEDFLAFLRDAEPGESCVYAEATSVAREGFSAVAGLALQAYYDGKVELAQKRVSRGHPAILNSCGKFEYVAQKRRKIVPVPLAPMYNGRTRVVMV